MSSAIIVTLAQAILTDARERLLNAVTQPRFGKTGHQRGCIIISKVLLLFWRLSIYAGAGFRKKEVYRNRIIEFIREIKKNCGINLYNIAGHRFVYFSLGYKNNYFRRSGVDFFRGYCVLVCFIYFRFYGWEE